MSTINMESTLLKPPVVSKIGLNCFELIFLTNWGGCGDILHFLAWEGKSGLILI